MELEAPEARRRFQPPPWTKVALALVLAFIYLRGLRGDPLRWEEPRRALVAAEMIHRGDYVVPRLLGEPYLNKPPLQSWAIALLAGGEARRVGPLAVRLPTLLAVAGIALLLWRLGHSARSGPHALAPLVFLTFGILPQYGRPGEIDLLFTFWTTAALAAFELGRRTRRPALQWLWSQGLVGFGILTKGLAPLFVHAPVAFLAWRRPAEVRPRLMPVLAGLALLLAVTAAWVVPYALRGPAEALAGRLGAEVAQRTVDSDPLEALRHIVRYPFVLVAATAPWSALLLVLTSTRTRARLRGLLGDPWIALAATVVAWGVLVFALVPGTLPRYLIPILPLAAVAAAATLERLDRPASSGWPWLALAGLWIGGAAAAATRLLGALPEPEARSLVAVTIAIGLLAIAAGFSIARAGAALAASLLVAGLLYGLFYAGVLQARAGQRPRALVAAAETIAGRVRPDVPLVVAEGTDRGLTWPLAHRLDRPLLERPPEGRYDFVAPVAVTPPGRARLVREAGGFALWRVRDR